jgi:hypothetical protein
MKKTKPPLLRSQSEYAGSHRQQDDTDHSEQEQYEWGARHGFEDHYQSEDIISQLANVSWLSLLCCSVLSALFLDVSLVASYRGHCLLGMTYQGQGYKGLWLDTSVVFSYRCWWSAGCGCCLRMRCAGMAELGCCCYWERGRPALSCPVKSTEKVSGYQPPVLGIGGISSGYGGQVRRG